MFFRLHRHQQLHHQKSERQGRRRRGKGNIPTHLIVCIPFFFKRQGKGGTRRRFNETGVKKKLNREKQGQPTNINFIVRKLDDVRKRKNGILM